MRKTCLQFDDLTLKALIILCDLEMRNMTNQLKICIFNRLAYHLSYNSINILKKFNENEIELLRNYIGLTTKNDTIRHISIKEEKNIKDTIMNSIIK